MPTELERLAALEAKQEIILSLLRTMDTKVENLLAFSNRSSGMEKIGSMVLNAAIGALGAVGGYFVAKPHP